MKRSRRSSDAGDSLTQDEPNALGERHPSLWREDGNIIISAKSVETGKTLLFRVHKSILSRQSDVFAGLFSLPDTSANYGGPDDVNDIPLVHLPLSTILTLAENFRQRTQTLREEAES